MTHCLSISQSHGIEGYPEVPVCLSGLGFEDGHAPEKTGTTSVHGTGCSDRENDCGSRGRHGGVVRMLIHREE